MQIGESIPIFFRHERSNFAFALDNQSHRDTLHSTGRQATGHLSPEQWRQFKTHHPIQKRRACWA